MAAVGHQATLMILEWGRLALCGARARDAS